MDIGVELAEELSEGPVDHGIQDRCEWGADNHEDYIADGHVHDVKVGDTAAHVAISKHDVDDEGVAYQGQDGDDTECDVIKIMKLIVQLDARQPEISYIDIKLLPLSLCVPYLNQ